MNDPHNLHEIVMQMLREILENERRIRELPQQNLAQLLFHLTGANRLANPLPVREIEKKAFEAAVAFYASSLERFGNRHEALLRDQLGEHFSKVGQLAVRLQEILAASELCKTVTESATSSAKLLTEKARNLAADAESVRQNSARAKSEMQELVTILRFTIAILAVNIGALGVCIYAILHR